MRMKRSGRASIVIVVMIALVAAVVFLFLMAGDSPSGVAGRFLTALAKGDSKTLTELSFMEGKSADQIQKEWEETHSASKYWQFAWKIQNTKEQDPNNVTVILEWVKNSANPSAYSEKYELPLIKKDNHWKVDVRGISREMYPNLPR